MRSNRFFSVATLFAIALVGGLFFAAAPQVISAQEAEVLGIPDEVEITEDIEPAVNVQNRRLNFTHMRTNPSFLTTSCSGSGCIAQRSAFSPAVVSKGCPGSTGTTCTVKLKFCGQFSANTASLGDNMLIRFLIDGVRPVPGPTDGSGFVSVESPIINTGRIVSRCFNVVDTVGNPAGNPINVEVRFAVQDLTGDGASVNLGFAELNIEVYKP
jgi:hypothetical protein